MRLSVRNLNSLIILTLVLVTSAAVPMQNIHAASAVQTGITLDRSHIFMFARGNVRVAEKLKVTAYPGPYTPEVEWSSNNPSVATVNEEGEVKALKPGTAVIKATTLDGEYSATCRVTALAVTRERIASKWEQYKPYKEPYEVTDDYRFQELPRFTAPYRAGKLKPQFLQDGLNMANFVRYLAGLPDDLVLDEDLTSNAQHGSVLLSVSEYSHAPPQPADMDDEFYNIAIGGTMGNIAAGVPTIEGTIRFGYMPDFHVSNLTHVGHRRSILSSQAKSIGLGFVYNKNSQYEYSSMQRRNDREEFVDNDYVAWPNQGYFPSRFFSTLHPWSVSLEWGIYIEPDIEQVEVRLTRLSDGKVWNFDKSHDNLNLRDRYFNVCNSAFGYEIGAVIFRPEGIDKYQGSYKVEITGLMKWGSGEDYSDIIEYIVNFYDMDKYSWTPVQSVSLNQTKITLDTGESRTLTAAVTPTKASDKSLIWSSNNTLVATVNEQGRVTAVGPGEATITVTTIDREKTARSYVTVPYIPLESLTLNDTTLYMQGVRSRERQAPQATPANATCKEVTWNSDNETVVTVSPNGVLTAVASGEAVITARSVRYENIIATFTVTVEDDGIYYGDANGDGYINVSDAIRVLRHIVGLTEIEQEQYAAADVTGSGTITVTDAIRILRYIVGLY